MDHIRVVSRINNAKACHMCKVTPSFALYPGASGVGLSACHQHLAEIIRMMFANNNLALDVLTKTEAKSSVENA